MKIAHVADVHTGFRRFNRNTPQGVNQREADVALAFERIVDDLIKEKPDVVLIAGDIFHSVRPTNVAILFMDGQLNRLRRELPHTIILIVAGNHDTARSTESGSILPLFRRIPKTYVATGKVQEVEIFGVNFCMVPTAAVRHPFKPKPGRQNVLLIHAGLAGKVGIRSVSASANVAFEESQQEGWNYVALGDWHVPQQVGRRAWYSGSTEYTSTNPWSELKDEVALYGKTGKGYLLVEVTDGDPVVEFRRIQLARRHIDGVPIDGEGLTAPQIIERVMTLQALDQLDGAIVRQLVTNVPRSIRREAGIAPALTELRRRAQEFFLDMRAPDRQARGLLLDMIADPSPEEWEIEQEKEAEYWDGTDPNWRVDGSGMETTLTRENITDQADKFVDPYA